jgi:hypothetical protein
LTGYKFVIGFIEHLRNVTINNYDSLSELLQISLLTTADIKSSAFPSRCSVAAFNGGCSPYSGFPNSPRLQLQQLSTDCHFPTYISARIAQKTPFRCYCIKLLPWKRACLRSLYLVTAVVYLLILRSLPSNGSTCHSMMDKNKEEYTKMQAE